MSSNGEHSLYGGIDLITLNQTRQLTDNINSLQQLGLVRRTIDQRRNVDKECGYPSFPIDPWVYQQLYDINPLAARVVDILPLESWQSNVEIYEEERGRDTEFEKSLKELEEMLQGEDSWYQGEDSIICEYLLRCDITCGIGHYGVMFLAFDDKKNWHEAVEPKKGMKLLYVRCLPQTLATVTQWETDKDSPRYSLPKTYNLTFFDPHNISGGVGVSTQSHNVHWSRVVHITDNVLTNEVYHIPRMQQVLYPILDVHKVRAASAEMYWMAALPGMSFETHPQLGGEVTVDTSKLKQNIQDYFNSLQRYVLTKGMSIRQLSPTVVDPSSQINVQLESIGVRMGIPIRILKGSERGQLASSQDERSWNDRLKRRQLRTIGPRIIAPFINRLISLQILKPPKDKYKIYWTEISEQTESEKMVTASQITQTLAGYLSGNVESIIPPAEFLSHVLKWKEDQIKSVMEAAVEHQEELAEVQEQQQEQQQQQYGDEAGYGQEQEGNEDIGEEEETENELTVHGSEDSGNYDHEGRPGKVGGSGPKKSTLLSSKDMLNDIYENFKDRSYKEIEQRVTQIFAPMTKEAALEVSKQFTPYDKAKSKPQAIKAAIRRIFDRKGSWERTQFRANKKGKKRSIYVEHGGEGSGNYGHSGRLKKVGGSGPSRMSKEDTVPPPPGKAYTPKVYRDKNNDGVTLAARVGVPGDQVPPPPPLVPMPNLTRKERAVEQAFLNAYQDDPDFIAARFKDAVIARGYPPVFGTDDAKELSEDWSGEHLSLEERAVNRAIYNVALHQTANAIAKRAFLQHLDTLQPNDQVMITVGGCGAGKGYALKNIPQALEQKGKSAAIWDSAGDQSATENPWLQRELEKRGLKGVYVYVDADPYTQWAHPERGVVSRAKDIRDGRMVDAAVFADSYAIGASNHQAFYTKNKSNPNASFIFIQNGSPPELLNGIPKKALEINHKELRRFAVKTLRDREDVPSHIRRGGTMGQRIWGTKVKENMTMNKKHDTVKDSFDDTQEWLEEVHSKERLRHIIRAKKYQVKGCNPEKPLLDNEGVEIEEEE